MSHLIKNCSKNVNRHYAKRFFSNHHHVLVAGGGTGGASTAHNFVNKLGKDKVAVIEPSDEHYYQPMWTLVGAGAKKFEQSSIPMNLALPKNAKRYKDVVTKFEPDNNYVTLKSGTKLTYDYLVVALGIQLAYDQIPGALEALQNDVRVGSNYSPVYVHKTYDAFKQFSGGNALFSFPNTPVKCAGAPQKIMYLFDDYLRMEKKRDNANIHYFTSLPVIFTVKKYADKLNEICIERSLNVATRHNLVEVDPLKHIATFENLDTKEKTNLEYNFLHITPPMKSFDVVKQSPLADANGYVDVDKLSLQHVRYPNVFALGDCSNLPTSKTAAAIAVQQNVLYVNLFSVMNKGSADKLQYDGYTSCPLVTKYNKCVLAEFDYNSMPLETFPFNQARESTMSFVMKAHVMPQLYWYGLIKGLWNGPTVVRKILHLGMSK